MSNPNKPKLPSERILGRFRAVSKPAEDWSVYYIAKVVESLLVYLDEQHAAGQEEPKPVDGPDTEEALAALEEIRDDTLVRNQGMLARLEIIRSALTSAAQEDAAWREIEAYWTCGISARRFLSIDYNGLWFVHLGPEVIFGESSFRGPTRLAAIVAAGEYCRAEREKTR